MDGCALIEYEIGNDKQEHEFFIVLQMNGNIILGRDCLKQFGVHMYYDLGCIRVGKSYIKLEEDVHISSIARLTTEIIIKPQSGKVCLYRVKGNEQALNSKLHKLSQKKQYSQPGTWTTNCKLCSEGHQTRYVFWHS